MSDESLVKEQIEAAVRTIDGWHSAELLITSAIPVLASPSWRGVDGSPWRVHARQSGKSLFAKVMDADAALHIDVPCAFEAARRAGDLGIGPEVLFADPQSGVLVMEDLGDGWQVARLEMFRDPALVERVLDTRCRFHSTPPLPRSLGVFDEVELYYERTRTGDAGLPSDVGWLFDNVMLAADTLRAVAEKPVPIHGDGNASNVMVSRAGEVRLLDWDRATNADPLEDLGSFLVETFAFEPEAREAFARQYGGFDERRFNRACLYGTADDLRWGLIAALVASRSRRTTFEFYKFASWRFLRCRIAVRDPRFSERLRRI